MDALLSLADKINPFVVFIILLLLVYLGYTFFIVYHLVRFGIGAQPKVIATIFFAGSVILLLIVAGLYFTIDTQEIVTRLEQVIRDFMNAPIF